MVSKTGLQDVPEIADQSGQWSPSCQRNQCACSAMWSVFSHLPPTWLAEMPALQTHRGCGLCAGCLAQAATCQPQPMALQWSPVVIRTHGAAPRCAAAGSGVGSCLKCCWACCFVSNKWFVGLLNGSSPGKAVFSWFPGSTALGRCNQQLHASCLLSLFAPCGSVACPAWFFALFAQLASSLCAA